MNHRHIRPVKLAGILLLSTLLLAPAAFAQHGPGHGDKGMHSGMGGQGGMGGMGGGKGMRGMGHAMLPHNAAEHFLQMAGWLELTDSQIARMRTLRDDWITTHAVHEAQLAAAMADLKAALFAPEVDKAAAEKAIATIGNLKRALWPAFVDHLAELKGMLDRKQRDLLAERHRHHR